MIKAFIIHLAASVKRRTQVEVIREKLPISTELIDAVDVHNLSDADADRVKTSGLHAPSYPFGITNREVACFVSHRKAWQAIVDQNLKAGLVLEDDVALTPEFEKAYSAAAKFVRPDDFIRFPVKTDREKGPEVFSAEGARILLPNRVGLGMHAQLVGIGAARQLLELTGSFDRPVDTTLQMKWITGLSPLVVVPAGVTEISGELGGSTVQQKKSFLEKLRREILRPIYRLKVNFYSTSYRHGGLGLVTVFAMV